MIIINDVEIYRKKSPTFVFRMKIPKIKMQVHVVTVTILSVEHFQECL